MKVNDRHVSFYYENDDDYGKIEIDPKKQPCLSSICSMYLSPVR